MDKKYSCIIIEDEPLALEKTKGFVDLMLELELVGCFENSKEALFYLNENPVDIALVDVQMDELSGIDLIGATSNSAQFILTTAYDQYALKGYDLNVTDYLLKPFTFNRFTQAMNKAKEKIELNSKTKNAGIIFVKTEGRLVKINLNEILFIEGMRDYRRIHLVNQRIMTLQTFTEFEKLIDKNIVCRVHKSYMVGLKAIESIERKRIKIGEHRIPISETYSDVFFKLIK
ncbi:MAG: LytR/AlgR family response regulator transcription factor [Salibacteraceae bacterium]